MELGHRNVERVGPGIDLLPTVAAHHGAYHARFQQTAVAMQGEVIDDGGNDPPQPQPMRRMAHHVSHQIRQQRIAPGQCAVKIEHCNAG